MGRVRVAMGVVVLMFGVVGWARGGARAGATSPAEGLKVEKYRLGNGLTVILHEDHSLPTAGVNLWYRVGARNEPAGRSGFAHLFEHLMFMGTRRVPGSGFDDLMEKEGGSNNASTSLDRTNYYSSGPSKVLPTLLWLDADRMEELGRAMTREKLNLQRDVVRNEIRQQVENRPYGRAYERSYQLLYPAGHPYHMGVYGTHEDLEAATVNDVKDFFATFYVPENCSLVVAGDFDPTVIKPLVAKLFGSIPRGDVPAYRKVEPATLGREMRATMLDKVKQPGLRYSYLSPAAYADGDAEMDLIARMLADGRDSRLYRRLVMGDQTCVDVRAYQEGAALGSILRIEVDAKPEADLGRVEAAVDEEVGKLVKAGPTEEEVRRRAATIEMGILGSLQSAQARADRINEYEYYYGEPDSLHRDLERYRTASAGSVKGWAGKVLGGPGRVVIRVLPEESAGGADRAKRPADLAVAAFAPPAPVVARLSNGVKVYVFERHTVPLVMAGVVIKKPGGGVLEDASRAGVASLAAEMTQEGAGELDSVKFAEAVSALGGDMDASADYEDASVTVTMLARNFEKGAELLGDAVLRPRMGKEDFERVKGVRLDDLRQRDEEPGAVAAVVGDRWMMAEGNRYGLPVDGMVGTVEKASLEEVKGAWGKLVRDGEVSVIVAGDVSAGDVKAVMEGVFGKADLGDTRAAPSPSPRPSPGTPGEGEQAASAVFRDGGSKGMRVYVVDRPGAVQTVVRLEGPGVAFSDPGRVERRLANVVLGGSFTSRLNRNLREVHGYTYGAASGVDMRRTLGTFIASCSVKADVTGAAIKELMAELKRFSGGDISPDEAQKARETWRADVIDRFGTLGGLDGDLRHMLVLGADPGTTGKDLARAQTVDAAAMNAAAKREVALDRSVMVLVGDKKVIGEQVKDLGLPAMVEVDAEGNAGKKPE